MMYTVPIGMNVSWNRHSVQLKQDVHYAYSKLLQADGLADV